MILTRRFEFRVTSIALLLVKPSPDTSTTKMQNLSDLETVLSHILMLVEKGPRK